MKSKHLAFAFMLIAPVTTYAAEPQQPTADQAVVQNLLRQVGTASQKAVIAEANVAATQAQLLLEREYWRKYTGLDKPAKK